MSHAKKGVPRPPKKAPAPASRKAPAPASDAVLETAVASELLDKLQGKPGAKEDTSLMDWCDGLSPTRHPRDGYGVIEDLLCDELSPLPAHQRNKMPGLYEHDHRRDFKAANPGFTALYQKLLETGIDYNGHDTAHLREKVRLFLVTERLGTTK